MRYLISERKLGFAFLSFVIGVFVISQASLFAHPVLVSEKGLLFVIPGIALTVSSVLMGVRSVRKVV